MSELFNQSLPTQPAGARWSSRHDRVVLDPDPLTHWLLLELVNQELEALQS